MEIVCEVRVEFVVGMSSWYLELENLIELLLAW